MISTSRENLECEHLEDAAGFDGALMSLLMNSSLACIVSDHLGHIQQWNRGAEALLGWKAEEVLQQPLSKVMPEVRSFKDGATFDVAPGASRPEVSLPNKNGQTVRVKIDSTTLPATTSRKGGHLFLIQDITEKKFLEKALLEASEREQRRIGQELHDHLCQHLLGAAFAAKALAGALDRDQSEHAPRLHDLARLVNDGVSQVRDISRGLHPVELDASGLMSSLQELANRVAHSTPCTFRCERHVLVRNTSDALNAYRIAQDVVTVAMQQTGAESIEIALTHSGSSICLQISDDGKTEGELTADPAGFAAKTIQYRAQAMNGTLVLRFDPKKGTQAVCLFPS